MSHETARTITAERIGVHDLREDVLEQRELPPGTVVHLNGLPVQLTGAVVALTSIANWALIKKAVEQKPMN